MKYLVIVLLMYLSANVFANPYNKNALFMAYAHHYKMAKILELLSNEYKDDADFEIIQEEVVQNMEDIQILFQEKNQEAATIEIPKKQLEGSLAKICQYAIETEISGLKTIEFLNGRIDDFRLSYIFNRVVALSNDKYMPLLRECETRFN